MNGYLGRTPLEEKEKEIEQLEKVIETVKNDNEKQALEIKSLRGRIQSCKEINEALSTPSGIPDDFIPTGCAPKIVQVEEMEESYKLFKTMIKGHENKICNYFTDRIRRHFMERVPGIADDFMKELENIPVSKEDTLGLEYEMRFSIKEILLVIKEIKL